MNKIEQAVQKVTELQSKYKENQKQYWVAEQIKDICRENADNAELVFSDIDDKDMSIAEVEKKIEAYARKNGGCCPPQAADKIIRDFFGLGEFTNTDEEHNDIIRLEDFI